MTGGRHARPYIIAEIASAHEGNPDLAERLYRLAAETGADAVKFQIFRRDALLCHHHPKYASFGEIEMSAAAWRRLLQVAAELPPDLMVEVFDEESLALAEESGAVAAYKVPTSDLGNLPFLQRLAATGKPLHLGVGGAMLDEIDAAVACLRQAGAGERLVLMHGIQSFPTRLEDSHLAWIPSLLRRYGVPVGYADHVDAEEREWARLLPAMAVAVGARVIEKHLTDDRSRKGRDYYSSLEPAEFRSFVALLRQLPVALGGGDGVLGDAGTAYRYLMKRQAVAARPIGAGAPLQAGDVVFKRTGRAGLAPLEMTQLYGRAVGRDIAADEPITREDLA